MKFMYSSFRRRTKRRRLGFFVKVHFLRFSPWEINERQEDNIRKLRKVAAGDEAESDKAA